MPSAKASSRFQPSHIPYLYPMPKLDLGVKKPPDRSNSIGEMSWKPTYVSEDGPFSVTSTRNNNVPDRFESILLGEGEKKIVVEPETRVPNAAIFKIAKEDHTLGNIIRDRLLRNNAVLFAAYQVPHPLFPNIVLRVQTDGTLTPKEAVSNACKELITHFEQIKQEFTKEWELNRITRMGGEGDGLGDTNGYGMNGTNGTNGQNVGYQYGYGGGVNGY